MATLEQVQAIELDILKQIVEICDKHNIDYALAYGSLLGAVRHKGFIPWDDDIDIHIKYSDYKKLRKYCNMELPNHLFWQTYKTDRGAYNLYAKIRNENTYMLESRSNEEFEKMKQTHQGIWIDIMPIFRVAKSEKLFKKQIKYVLKGQYYVRQQRKLHLIKGNKSYSTFYMKFREIFGYRFMSQLYFMLMRVLQSKKSQKWFSYGFWSIGYTDNVEKCVEILHSNIISDEMLNNLKYYDFEDYQFKSYADYDKYLSDFYGKDYMIPKRKSHVEDYTKVIIN